MKEGGDGEKKKVGTVSLFILLICFFLGDLCPSSPSPSSSSLSSSCILMAMAAEVDDDVLRLDITNYSTVVEKHEFIVVAFIAPWCSYSKALMSTYNKVAAVLKTRDGVVDDDTTTIRLAMIDASDDDNKPVALQNDIKGFPTVKIFRRGKFFMEYDGPRETEAMVSYLLRQAGPPSLEITESEEVVKLIELNPVVVIGFFKRFEGESFENFMDIAEETRTEIPFYHTSNVSLLEVKGGPLSFLHSRSSLSGDGDGGGDDVDDGVRMYTAFDKEIYDSNVFVKEKLRQFVEEKSTPRVVSMNSDKKLGVFVMKAYNRDEPKVFAFVNGKEKVASTGIYAAIKVEAEEGMEEEEGGGGGGELLRYIVGDGNENFQALDFYGVKQADLPVVVIHDTENDKKYILPNATVASIGEFMEDFRNGKLVESIKSQPLSETNEEQNLVKVVVAHNFEEIVKRSGQNVLILFYAPWCNHCKRLMPNYEEVANHFSEEDDVTIAKFDATANDILDKKFTVKSYPTIYFRSSLGVLTWYVGTGDRDDLIAFVDMHKGDGLGDMEGETQVLNSAADVYSRKDEL